MNNPIKAFFLLVLLFHSVIGLTQIIRIDGVGSGDVGTTSLGAPCESQGMTGYRLVFETDFPEQISWNITNELGQVVISRSNYRAHGESDFNASIFVHHIYFCLPDGCYTFQLNDSGGDGLCCDNDSGFFSLSEVSRFGESLVLIEGADFGFRQSGEFCTGELVDCEEGSEVLSEYYDFDGSQEGWLCEFNGGCSYYEGSEVITGVGCIELAGATRVDSPPFFSPEDGRSYRVKFDAKSIGNKEGDSYAFVAYFATTNFTFEEFRFEDDYMNNSIQHNEVSIQLPLEYNNEQIGFRFVKFSDFGAESILYIDNVEVSTIATCPETKNGDKAIFGRRGKLEASRQVFNLSPNPVDGLLQITSSCSSAGSYLIHNSNGILMQRGKLAKNTGPINLSNFKSGLYFVSFECNGDFSRKRLIVR